MICFLPLSLRLALLGVQCAAEGAEVLCDWWGARPWLSFCLMHWGLSIEWATLSAATLVGMIGVHWSHRFLAHPKVFTVAAMIPMVPGVFAFKAMIALVEINHRGFTPELWGLLVENMLKAVFIVASLAIGLAMPGLLFYRRRPVV